MLGIRLWKNIEHMFATFRGAVNIGHIATFRGQIPHMLGQHLGVPPETLDQTIWHLKTPQNAVENEVSTARETVSAG